MEKQNKKCREEHDRKERKRIIDLVKLSKQFDPRIIEELARIQAEKDAEKAEKKAEKQKRFQEQEDRVRQREEARQK